MKTGKPTRIGFPLSCLFLVTFWTILPGDTVIAVAGAAEDSRKPDAAWPRFSGIYPHLAALADSYTEAGIGAVVPWWASTRSRPS